jgi:hypothetical protein
MKQVFAITDLNTYDSSLRKTDLKRGSLSIMSQQ